MLRSRILRWSVSTALLAAASAPNVAGACGGTFCDSGPTAMPVDQTGENILFVMDGTSVEAHVQIQYQGAADRFAWVVPMPQIPEVSVGSQPLFTNLLQGTVPTYGYQTQFDQCGGGLNVGTGAGGTSSFGGTGGLGGVADAGGGPQVVYEKTVGAFDVTVLQGGTAVEVSNWLTTNGYQTVPSAPAILNDYVAQSYVFVAVKLVGGATLNEIHPLVFRYPGNKPCVPLKLTAVAATEDMGVRAFFLGDDRVYPAPGYMHMTLNPVRIDWVNFAANYKQVVSRGADSVGANGRAFLTEYAGASSVVNTYGVYSPSWNDAAFATIKPEDVVDQLTTQGLANCYIVFPSSCTFNHPLVLPLLEQYLPAPTGIAETDFYANLHAYATQIDQQAWSASGFATDFKNRIVTPGQHAADMLARYPYLTRLYTTISPAEMQVDPEFVARPDLSDTVAPNASAALRVACNGQRGMILPDTREVGLPTNSTWPAFSSLMPWVERLEEVPPSGAPTVLVDNTAAIDQQLAAWNDSLKWPPPTGSGGTSSGGTNSGTTGGANASPSEGGPNAAAGGCGCSTPGGRSGSGIVLVIGVAMISLMRRRVRRSATA